MEHLVRTEEIRCIYNAVTSILRKIPLVGYGITWDIKTDIRNIGWKDLDCVHLPEDRISWRVLVINVNIHWVP
jgi:hypothetical protein